METYRTEDEQIEALRKWWKRNGTALLLGLLVALGGWFGWQGWQDHQRAQADSASLLYQQLLELDAEIQKQSNASRIATAKHLAGQLRTEYGSSTYALYAAALWAKIEAGRGQLDEAVSQYQWILQHEPAPAIERLTRLRLAELRFDQGKADEALAVLDKGDPGEFRADYDVLRGDIHHSRGDTAKAREAWQRAQSLAGAAGDERPLLKIKLDNLPAPAATADHSGKRGSVNDK